MTNVREKGEGRKKFLAYLSSIELPQYDSAN